MDLIALRESQKQGKNFIRKNVNLAAKSVFER